MQIQFEPVSWKEEKLEAAISVFSCIQTTSVMVRTRRLKELFKLQLLVTPMLMEKSGFFSLQNISGASGRNVASFSWSNQEKDPKFRRFNPLCAAQAGDTVSRPK